MLKKNVTILRRRYVMSMLVRRPNISQREIQEAIGDRLVNPNTNAPFSLGTINNDIQTVRQSWARKSGRDYGEWVSEEVAKLDEIESEAWRTNELSIVLRCMDRRARLMGLDKPQKLEHNWREQAKEDGINPDAIHRQLVSEFATAMVGGGASGSVPGSEADSD